MAQEMANVDIISVAEAKTLDGLFAERVRRTPGAIAYREYREAEGRWCDFTWQEVNRQFARWQRALENDGIGAGDRVAVMLRNCIAWITFDQSAMGLGAVVVPLYTQDRPENAAYIINDSGAKVLLLEDENQWRTFEAVRDQLKSLVRILLVNAPKADPADRRVIGVERWLPAEGGEAK